MFTVESPASPPPEDQGEVLVVAAEPMMDDVATIVDMAEIASDRIARLHNIPTLSTCKCINILIGVIFFIDNFNISFSDHIIMEHATRLLAHLNMEREQLVVDRIGMFADIQQLQLDKAQLAHQIEQSIDVTDKIAVDHKAEIRALKRKFEQDSKSKKHK